MREFKLYTFGSSEVNSIEYENNFLSGVFPVLNIHVHDVVT